MQLFVIVVESQRAQTHYDLLVLEGLFGFDYTRLAHLDVESCELDLVQAPCLSPNVDVDLIQNPSLKHKLWGSKHLGLIPH